MSCANNTLLAPYYSFIVNECAKLFAPKNTIHIDLANDIYLIMVNVPTKQLTQLIETNKLKPYIVTSIRNQRHSPTSRFAKLYKYETNYTTVPDIVDAPVDYTIKKTNLTDFEKDLLSLYVTYGTIERVAKALRTSKGTVAVYIKQIKDKLK